MSWFLTAIKKYAQFDGTPGNNRFGPNPKELE